MKLPELANITDKVTMSNAFLGLNQNLQIREGEFSDMANMTNDYYPTLGNRKKRGIIRSLTKPMGISGGRYLSYVDNNDFYYNENKVLELARNNKERSLVPMGAYICIFPDGVMYNTYDETVTYMDNEVTTTTKPKFTLCKLDGTNYTDANCITSNTAPTDTSKYWIDTSVDPVVLKSYSASVSAWVSIATTYVKIEATGIGVGFKAYDAVTLSGVDKSSAIYNNWDFNTSNLVYDRGDNFLIVAGLINKTFTNSKVITASRKMPQMDFVCELDNRIWGCSTDNHEIYASKQGDATNWYCYAGLDSDSYAVTVGTQNVFTGAIAYGGYAYFFKEDGYHKIYGTKPSNFEMSWKPCRGVQKGSEKSLCSFGEYLIYKARDGVCIFDGSVDKISDALGSYPLYEAVGGSYRDKYYVSMRDEDYRYRIYVYDVTKGTWCVESDERYKFLAYANGGMYAISENNTLYCINEEKIYSKWFPSSEVCPSDDLIAGNSVSGQSEGNFDWYVTTGDIGMDSPYQKYIKRLDIRLSIDSDAFVKFEISYDSMGDWEEVFKYYCTKKRSYSIPIPVKRADHVKLRISGKGEVRIFSIAKITEEGSDY